MDNEYVKKCLDIYEKGGTLYLIERIDKNEFCRQDVQMWRSDRPETWRDRYLWSKQIDFFTLFFLTKEDAENKLKLIRPTEGGCHCCGHGSKDVPVIITEHEFIPSSDKNKVK